VVLRRDPAGVLQDQGVVAGGLAVGVPRRDRRDGEAAPVAGAASLNCPPNFPGARLTLP
jgi:hypothetical protein